MQLTPPPNFQFSSDACLTYRTNFNVRASIFRSILPDSSATPTHMTPSVKKTTGKLAIYRWCSPSTPVFSTIKTDRHDITEILLKVALNTTTTLTLPTVWYSFLHFISIILILTEEL